MGGSCPMYCDFIDLRGVLQEGSTMQPKEGTPGFCSSQPSVSRTLLLHGPLPSLMVQHPTVILQHWRGPGVSFLSIPDPFSYSAPSTPQLPTDWEASIRTYTKQDGTVDHRGSGFQRVECPRPVLTRSKPSTLSTCFLIWRVKYLPWVSPFVTLVGDPQPLSSTLLPLMLRAWVHDKGPIVNSASPAMQSYHLPSLAIMTHKLCEHQPSPPIARFSGRKSGGRTRTARLSLGLSKMVSVG